MTLAVCITLGATPFWLVVLMFDPVVFEAVLSLATPMAGFAPVAPFAFSCGASFAVRSTRLFDECIPSFTPIPSPTPLPSPLTLCIVPPFPTLATIDGRDGGAGGIDVSTTFVDVGGTPGAPWATVASTCTPGVVMGTACVTGAVGATCPTGTAGATPTGAARAIEAWATGAMGVAEPTGTPEPTGTVEAAGGPTATGAGAAAGAM